MVEDETEMVIFHLYISLHICISGATKNGHRVY